MQTQVYKKLSWKTLLPAATAMGVMLLTPFIGAVDTAEAKRRGRGNGHHKSSKWNNRSRRSSNSHWNNGVRRRTRTRSGWDRRARDWDRRDRDRDDDIRRYRLRYRTRYDRFGNPYRQWYRSYF